MANQDRKLKLKKLDILFLVHNPLDCLIVYFCLCFSCLRIMYDFFDGSGTPVNAYGISVLFAVTLGIVMHRWAKREMIKLNLKDVLS